MVGAQTNSAEFLLGLNLSHFCPIKPFGEWEFHHSWGTSKDNIMRPTGLPDGIYLLMQALNLIVAVSLATLAGCATNSGVVPIGNGNYEVTGSSATALASGGSQKMKLLKRGQ